MLGPISDKLLFPSKFLEGYCWRMSCIKHPLSLLLGRKELTKHTWDCYSWKGLLQGWPLVGVWEFGFLEDSPNSLMWLTVPKVLAQTVVSVEHLFLFCESDTLVCARQRVPTCWILTPKCDDTRRWSLWEVTNSSGVGLVPHKRSSERSLAPSTMEDSMGSLKPRRGPSLSAPFSGFSPRTLAYTPSSTSSAQPHPVHCWENGIT